MYLGPHEFQVQARYFEDALHFATAALWPSGCGVMGLALDADALRNGTLNLLHASGIFPDGLPFYVPQADPAPATRAIAQLFPPTRDSLTVFLGLTRYQAGGRNCADSVDSCRKPATLPNPASFMTKPAARMRAPSPSGAKTSAFCWNRS